MMATFELPHSNRLDDPARVYIEDADRACEATLDAGSWSLSWDGFSSEPNRRSVTLSESGGGSVRELGA